MPSQPPVPALPTPLRVVPAGRRTVLGRLGLVGGALVVMLAIGGLVIGLFSLFDVLGPGHSALGDPVVPAPDGRVPAIVVTDGVSAPPVVAPTATGAPTARARPTAAPTFTRATTSGPAPATSPARARPKPVRSTAAGTATPRVVVTSVVPVAPAGVNLALHRVVTATSHTQNYLAANATDGDSASYWEGDTGFPQTLTVDLGSVTTVGRLVLALPCCSWPSRTQTIAVYGSTDGTNYRPLQAAAGYSFDAAAASNTAASTIAATAARFVQLRFTANTGWPAAQLSELQIYS